jgi:N-acetylmuramoyl-L-alanine amidase
VGELGREFASRSSLGSRSSTASWSVRGPEPGNGRSLTESERRALRARRDSRTEPKTPQVGPSKPVPKMPKTRQDTRVRSPGITVAGTLLIVGLTVLAFAGGRLFGRVDEATSGLQPVEAVVPEAPVSEQQFEVAAPESEPPIVTPEPLPTTFARAPVVCLDPGHGGDDRGFQSLFTDGSPSMEESVLVLEHAWDLEARLQQRGFTVVMTRETDAAVNLDGADVNGDGRTAAHDPPRSDRNKNLDELQARINICNEAHADLLVSMHVNGYSNGTPRGYETWFTRERDFGEKNAVFATLAYAHLKEQLGYIGYVLPEEEERGVLPDTTADVQKEHSLFRHFIMTGPAIPGVVDPSTMPGATIETLFVSNTGDAAILASPEGRNAIVTAYENAIVDYFVDYYPPGANQAATPVAQSGE